MTAMSIGLGLTLWVSIALSPWSDGRDAHGDEQRVRQTASTAPRPHTATADPDALRRAAMNQGGDPKRGKAVYLSAAAKCATCHKVHGQGAEVGPDLSQVGGKL